MNSLFKKIASPFMAIVVAGVTLVSTSTGASAAILGTTEQSWTTGWINKDYYRQTNTEISGDYYTREKLTRTVYWARNASSVAIAISQGASYSSQNTYSHTTSSTVSVSGKTQAVEVGGSFTYSYTNTKSHTFTQNEVQSYTYTLTKSDQVGYYAITATTVYHKVKVDLWKKPTKNGKETYLGFEWQSTYKTNEPMIELYRQSSAF